MASVPAQLAALLGHLTPQEQDTFLAILSNSCDEESFLGELQKHPDILKVMQTLVTAVKTVSTSDMPTELPTILRELRQPAKSPHQMQRRAEQCRIALTMVKRKENADLWAVLHTELAHSLVNIRQDPRVENLEYAIEHYQLALRVRTREADPAGWALIQNRLAGVYVRRIRGNPADNLELALMHTQQALQVYTRETDPEGWGMAQHNLGLIHSKRLHGNQAANLELAIEHCKYALEVRTCVTDPVRWAMTQLSLSDLYFRRIRGEEADNLEIALMHAEQALQVYTRETDPDSWARVQNGLANIYGDRLHGDQAQNRERAIDHFTQALTVWTREADPLGWAMIHHNLGSIYRKRLHGNRADNLELAIEHCKYALEERTHETNPSGWATTTFHLGSLYGDRLHGDQAQNRERAIDHFKQALTVWMCEADPVGWAMIQQNLAVAYANRVCGKRVENVGQAHGHYEQVLTVFTLQNFPQKYQQTQRNIGDLHFIEGAWAAALIAYQEAVRAEQMLLGAAYTEVGRREEVAKTAVLYGRIAYTLLKLGRLGEALIQLEQGKARLLSRALALNEVDISFLPESNQERLHQLRRVIRELETEIRFSSQSIVQGEQRVLAEALDQARGELNDVIKSIRADHPDFMPESLSLPEILALIPPHGALVAPIFTSQGSAVFVVPDGQHSVSMEHVHLLDQFKETDLEVLLKGPALDPSEEPRIGGWLGAYFNECTDEQAWLDIIEITGKTLWTNVMAPIAERLATLHVSHVLLMPQGGLGLLPLHSAWHEVDGTRRYFLDDYAVTYLPSAYAHKTSIKRMDNPQRQTRSLLAVINPTKDLKFATVEGEQVAGLFEKNQATVLPNADVDATVMAVMKQEMSGYVHFSSHGFYRWDDPMQSGLVLANREPLTLAQIIGKLNLDKTRLVTLSACETGIIDIRQSPDEYLGLPAGFLQAGAPAVVSTLWAVNDLSTMLLMERFYQLHLQENLDIPEALRQAQIWLREVTAGELAKRFATEEEALLSSTRLPIETASAYCTRFTVQDPEQRPFAHPYYWAAFTFSGA